MALGTVVNSYGIYYEIHGGVGPAGAYDNPNDLFGDALCTLQTAYKIPPYNTTYFHNYIQNRIFSFSETSMGWAYSEYGSTYRIAAIPDVTAGHCHLASMPDWITVTDDAGNPLAVNDQIENDDTIYIYPSENTGEARIGSVVFSAAKAGNSYQTDGPLSAEIEVNQTGIAVPIGVTVADLGSDTNFTLYDGVGQVEEDSTLITLYIVAEYAGRNEGEQFMISYRIWVNSNSAGSGYITLESSANTLTDPNPQINIVGYTAQPGDNIEVELNY